MIKQEEPKKLLDGLRALPVETEWVEFKEVPLTNENLNENLERAGY